MRYLSFLTSVIKEGGGDKQLGTIKESLQEAGEMISAKEENEKGTRFV